MNGTQNTPVSINYDPAAPISNTGALIFAYNNSTFDYVAIAELAARLVKQHLGLLTTLVTDVPISSTAFEHVILDPHVGSNHRVFRLPGGDISVLWKNRGRWRAHELTPYSRTLLIDADYIVRTNYLSAAVNSTAPFLAWRTASDVTGKNKLAGDARISRTGPDMWWATVVAFTKNDSQSQLIFSLWQHVAQHWDYYAHLYSFKRGMFRNDFALSIAVHMAAGMSRAGYAAFELPGSLPTLSSSDSVVSADSRRIIVADGVNRAAVYTDLHIMNKHAFTDAITKELLDA